MQVNKEIDSTVYGNTYHIKRVLEDIDKAGTPVSFDLETRSIYPKATREKASSYLEDEDTYPEGLPPTIKNEYTRIKYSSGLSHPSMVRTTHIILGIDKTTTKVFVVDEALEKLVFNWLVNTEVKVLIHNTLFDLKLVYHRTGKVPKNFEDTQLMAMDVVNDCEDYNRRVSLKVLMGSHYPAKWSIKSETDYEVSNLKDENFLEYCHYDGVSVMHLYELLEEER